MKVSIGDFKPNDRAKKYVADIMRTGRLSYGKYHRQFEKKFAEFHDCKYGVFCNSGTSALHIALQALKELHGWADGDEVLVPAVTFVATVNIVLHNKMTPVLVDVDRNTYNIDYKRIEEAITPRTRAIIPVHLTGLPADMLVIREIANTRNLKIIEDSCEAVGATVGGRKVGSFGDIGCFSTYMAHYIVTGVGGMATTNDPDLAVKLRSLMNHGRDSIYLNIDDDKEVSKEIIEGRFRFVSSGHSFRCTEFEAALGLSQMPDIEEVIKARQNNAENLRTRLSDFKQHVKLPFNTFHNFDNNFEPYKIESVFMVYPLMINRGSKRPFLNFLEVNGVETRDLLPLTNQPVYKSLFSNCDTRYPVASEINKRGFYIGCHQYLKKAHLSYIEFLFRSFRWPRG